MHFLYLPVYSSHLEILHQENLSRKSCQEAVVKKRNSNVLELKMVQIYSNSQFCVMLPFFLKLKLLGLMCRSYFTSNTRVTITPIMELK